MKLATVRSGLGTTTVRIEGDHAVDLGITDLGLLLAEPDWQERAAAEGDELATADLDYAPLITNPGKIVCIGLNYRSHILETGHEIPEYPTVFAKWPETLLGARDDIQMAPESEKIDWEIELAVIIGKSVRRADEAEAAAAIAGFSVLNDISMRDWQRRSPMWDQGKNFENTTPLGPVMVTPDELPGGANPALDITCKVNDMVVQHDNTGDLVFGPVALVQYLSTFITLKPGDVIATGTTGGVGAARKPQLFLADGDIVTTHIDGIGTLINRAVAEQV
ncbi:fumarylacetoacetate hydrolase family protein [Ammonicoccus fulvus]|uniref:Fumarylacetoacetate hydrolase family protein n=1 Tax=Ammonicoccus fulvus TaxID=3138240 RepID=A0ABZ3FS60_9ACTN